MSVNFGFIDEKNRKFIEKGLDGSAEIIFVYRLAAVLISLSESEGEQGKELLGLVYTNLTASLPQELPPLMKENQRERYEQLQDLLTVAMGRLQGLDVQPDMDLKH